MASYLQIVLALFAFATSHRAEIQSLWQSLVKLYLASRDAINGIKDKFPDAAFPGEGVLSLEGIADVQTLETEAKLEALLAPDEVPGVEALKMPSGIKLRDLIGWLRTSEIGKVFLAKVLAGFGS